MSVKIYSGLKIKANTLDEVLEKTDQLSQIVKYIMLKESLCSDLRFSINEYDNFFINRALNIQQDISNNSFLKSGTYKRRDVLTDLAKTPEDIYEEMAFCIMHKKVSIQGEGHYLLMPYYKNIYSNKEIESNFENFGIKEYGYWNNVDVPPELENEWPEREKNWEYALLNTQTGIPEIEGITTILNRVSRMDYISDVEAKEKLDIQEKNIIKIGEYLKKSSRVQNALSKYIKELAEIHISNTVDESKFNKDEYYSFKRKYEKLLENNEGEFADVEKVKERKTLLEEVLKEEITLSDLRLSPNQISESLNKRKNKLN